MTPLALTGLKPGYNLKRGSSEAFKVVMETAGEEGGEARESANAEAFGCSRKKN